MDHAWTMYQYLRPSMCNKQIDGRKKGCSKILPVINRFCYGPSAPLDEHCLSIKIGHKRLSSFLFAGLVQLKDCESVLFSVK